MDLNKLKKRVVIAGLIFSSLAIQTKAAIADTLNTNKSKNIKQTEKIADISDITSHNLDDTFFLEPDIQKDTNNITDTNNTVNTSDVLDLFNTPGFLNDSEKQEFDTLRDKATKHKYRYIYKGEILEMMVDTKKDSYKAIIILAILSRVDSTNSLTKRACTEIDKSPVLELRYEYIEKTIKSKERLDKSKERLDKSKERLDKSKERLDKSKERLDELKKNIEKLEQEIKEIEKHTEELKKHSEELKKSTEELKKLNKALEEMKKLFEEYQK